MNRPSGSIAALLVSFLIPQKRRRLGRRERACSIAALLVSLLILLFIRHPADAQNHDIERYFTTYQREFERTVQRLETVPSYDEFNHRLELKLNVLRALWEKDRDLLRERAQAEGNEDVAYDEIDHFYLEWERETAEKVSEAKASYLARHVPKDLSAVEEVRRRLMEKLSMRYQELLEAYLGEDAEGTKGMLFQGYRQEVVHDYEREAELLEGGVELEFEILKKRLGEAGVAEGIVPRHIDDALELEKQRYIYEKKVFLASLLNSYMNRASFDLFSDRQSLRSQKEEEHARRVADDIQRRLEDELSKSVEERLDTLLSGEVLSGRDVSALSDAVKGFYEKGLEIWEDAAVELVRREQEWYRGYDEVYSEGMDAWVRALDSFRERKERWIEDFSKKIEEGLQNWEEVFAGLKDAKDELLEVLRQYGMERGKDFDACITSITDTLKYGAESVQQIDSYLEEFAFMVRDRMSPIVPEGQDLNEQQIRLLVSLVQSLTIREGGIWQIAFYDPLSFWKPDKGREELFNLKTLTVRDEHYLETGTDYFIQEPSCYFLSRETIENGFRLKVRATAKVRRYYEYFGGPIGDKGPRLAFGDRQEDRFYYINFVSTGGHSWRRSVSYDVVDETADFTIPVLDVELNFMVSDVKRYLDIMRNLRWDKSDVLRSIQDVQVGVVEKLAGEAIPDDPVFSNEELFNEYYFGGENAFLMDDLDRELYGAFYEKEFWDRQHSVIEGVLEYALSRGMGATEQETVQAYEEARFRYEEAFEAFRDLLEGVEDADGRRYGGLRQAEGEIGDLTAEFEVKKAELSSAEEELRRAINRLTNLRVAAANLDMLVRSMQEQVQGAVERKYALLESIWQFDDAKQKEATGNLLRIAFMSAELQCEKILEEYFDPANSSSLFAMEEFYESFKNTMNLLSTTISTTGTGSLTADPIREMAHSLHLLQAAIADRVLYSEIVPGIRRLEDRLDGMAAVLGEGDELQKREVLAELYRDVYLAGRQFHSMIGAKKAAYDELFIHYMDPAGYLVEEQTKYSGEYMDDVKQFLGRRAEECEGRMGELLEELGKRINNGVDGVSMPELQAYISDTFAHFMEEMRAEALDFGGVDFQKAGWIEKLERILMDEELIERFSKVADDFLKGLDLGKAGSKEDAVAAFLSGVEGAVSEDRMKWKALWDAVEAEAPGRGVEELLLELRERDPESFFALKELFYETLPNLSQYETAYSLQSSGSLAQKLKFFEALLLPGLKSSGVLEGFTSGLREAVDATNRLLQLDSLSKINRRIEDCYYNRKSDEVQPVAGNLDAALLQIFSDMRLFEENPLLSAKGPALFKTMADYIASILYLTHGSAFAQVGREGRSAIINDNLVDYFSALRARAGELGFSEAERREIDDTFMRFLNVNALVESQDALSEAYEHSSFKRMVEERVNELVEGAYRDYRGVIYAERDVIEDEDLLKNLYSMQDVDPSGVAAAMSYIALDNPSRDTILSRIYFEGSGTYQYQYDNGDSEGMVHTAITYVTGDRAVNIYIEFQNRFVQALISLTGLANLEKHDAPNDSSLEESAEEYMNEFLAAHVGGGAGEIDIFHDPRFMSITAIENDGDGVEALRGKKNLLSLLCSSIVAQDRDGIHITDSRFSDEELLYMLASVGEIEGLGDDLMDDIQMARGDVTHHERIVQYLRDEIDTLDRRLAEAREAYNGIVNRLKGLKKGVDQSYQEYLAAKEKYFYATNIYLGEDTSHGAFEMYREQLCRYAAEKAEAEERYALLKAIKMGEGSAENNADGLAAYARELEVWKSSLNETEEALLLLKIFDHLLSSKQGALHGRLEAVEETLGSEGLPQKRIEELEGVRRSIEWEIGKLDGIDGQYGALDLSRGTQAYSILQEGLTRPGTMDGAAVDGYIGRLGDFILRRGGEIFKSTANRTTAMMVVELEDYLMEQEELYHVCMEEAGRAYEGRFNSFLYAHLSTYTEYRSRLAEYETERKVIEQEIGYLVSGLTLKEQGIYDGYVESYRGRWDELNEVDVDKKYRSLLMLERRMEELEELLLVYGYLSGSVGDESLTIREKERWGADLSVLMEKYGIEDEDVVRYADLLAEGMSLSHFDFSYTGLLKAELGRRMELLERVNPLGYYNTITGNDLPWKILTGLKEAHRIIDEDRVTLEQYQFDFQIGSVAQEKARYQEKVMLGKVRGLSEWDTQLQRIRGAYRNWLDEMKGRFAEGEEEWHSKEVEYVRRQKEWVEDIQRNDTFSGDKGLSAVEKAVEELVQSTDIRLNDLRVSGKEIEREYEKEIAIPKWVGNYEVIANALFTPLKKKAYGVTAVEDMICGLRERIALFKEQEEELEAEKLYFRLIKARDAMLAEIRGLDEGNRAMIEEVLEESGFRKEGGGYVKRVFSDYSLIGGKKYSEERIGLYEPYSIDTRRFSLGGIVGLRAAGDSVERQIYVLREVERLRLAKEEVLGNERMVGGVYVRHIGRFPTQDELGRYVEENQGKGLFGGLQELLGNMVAGVFSLFGRREKGESQEDFSEFQKRLQVEISYGMNRPLETGRIMLEYQRLVVLEAEAESIEDAGFFNAPLIPGGPSLKSVGNVALAVATAGASSVVQGIAQVGWSAFTTVSTALEGHIGWDEAGLSIMKDVAVSALTGGFSSEGRSIGEMTLRDLGSVSANISGVVKKGLHDVGRHMMTQTAVSAVNAFELDDHGRLIWSESSFSAGFGEGLTSSFGVFGGSVVSSAYDVAHGAEWSGGGFNYHYMMDKSGGFLVQDYYNLDMKRFGNMLGGLTEQLINNAMGVSDGIALNVLNARDFGLKHDVGLVEVTLGGSNGFRWDVSTSGLDVSVSGISSVLLGAERLKLYDEIAGGGSADLKVAYLAENKLRYSYDELSEEEREAFQGEFERLFNELTGYLKGGGVIGLELESEVNRREGDVIHLAREYFTEDRFGVEGRVVELGLNDAAKIASLIAHELMHDGGSVTDEVQEDILAHTIDAVVWKGLKERFGVYSSEMDEKLLAYEYFGSEGFEEYLGQRYVLGEDANLLKDWSIGARLKFIEARVLKDQLLGKQTSAEALAYYSLMKGFRGRGEEWALLYDELGIMHTAQRRMVSLMGQGYELLRGEEGFVKETEVVEVDFGNIEPLEGYIFLSQMRSLVSTVEGAVLTQRFGIEDDRGMRSIRSDYYTLAYSGFGEGTLESTMGMHVKRFLEFIRVLENPETLKEVVRSSYEEIQQSLTEEEGWDDKPRWLQGEYEKCVKAQCNLGSVNMMQLLGFDRYYGERYRGVAHLTTDPNTGKEILTSDIIEDMMALDDFVPIDQVLDFESMETPEELMEAISELKNYAVLTMKNYLGDPSHMSVLIGGESYDVNYRLKDIYGAVPLWVTMRGMHKINGLLSTSLEYGSFNFFNKWIEKQIEIKKKEMSMEKALEEARTFYSNEFGPYEYEILIPKYSVLYSTELQNLWELLDSYR